MRNRRIIEVDMEFSTQFGHQPLQDDDVGQTLGESLGIVEQDDVWGNSRELCSGV